MIKKALLALVLLASTALLAQSGPVPSDYFGITTVDPNTYPSVSFGTLGKGAQTSMSYIEQTKGTFVWTTLDAYVATANSHSAPFHWAMDEVPPWAVTGTSTCHVSVPGISKCSGDVTDVAGLDAFYTALTTRYNGSTGHGHIDVFELYNEPESAFTGTIANLVTQTNDLATAVRANAPSAKVAGLQTTYPDTYYTPGNLLDTYWAAGGTKALDEVGFHGYPHHGNDVPEIVNTFVPFIKAALVRNGISSTMPIYQTEGSWGDVTQTGWTVTDPSQQAAWVARTYLLAWSQGVSRYIWYGWNAYPWGALWYASPPPSGLSSGVNQAGVAYGQIYSWMVGSTLTSPCAIQSGTVWTCGFTKANGQQTLAVWNTAGSSSYSGASYINYLDLAGGSHTISGSVTIGIQPLLLVGPPALPFYVDAVNGLDSNDGTCKVHGAVGCTSTNNGPWRTFLKANQSATLGPNGTIIHFADGTYVQNSAANCVGNTSAAFCITHGGTSATQTLTYQCDKGLFGNAGHPGVPGHCLIRPSVNVNDPQLIGHSSANWTVIQGFDIGGDAAHPATQEQAGILYQAKDGTANHVEASYNYIHDMASGAPANNNTNGEGAGCPMQGMIAFANETGGNVNATPIGARFIGNRINNGGLLTNTACNEFHGMYIGGGPNVVVENNIVSNTTGSGIKLYGANCQSVVSNNLVFHTAWWGILVQDNGQGTCAAHGFSVGKSTINNNEIINTGFNKNCGAIAEGGTISGELFANNLIIGPNNPIYPSVNCTNQPGTPIPAPSIVSGTINTTTNPTLTPANTFVNYLDDGTGDYHLKASSAAIGTGTTSCVAGGLNPCVIGFDYFDVVRTNLPSIGPIEFTALGGAGIPSISPSPAQFASTPAASCTGNLTITLSNAGTANFTINGTFSLADSTNFQLVAGGSCAFNQTITPSASCTQLAKFCPTTTGALSTVLTMPNSVALTTDTLQGTGTSALSPTVALSLSTIPFANQNVNTLSGFIPFTITNNGTAALAITSIVPSDAANWSVTHNCPASIAISGSCTVKPIFKPTSTGAKSGTINITSNAPSSVDHVTVTGTGVQSNVSALPTSLVFSDTPVGSTSASQNITITNNGNGQAAMTIATSGDYLQTNTCAAGFSDTFALGTLNPVIWIKDSGNAPGNITGMNGSTFSTSNVDLSQSVLGLKVTQAQSTVTVSGIDDFADTGGTTNCTINDWCWTHDSGTPGSASATSSLVASPSLDGQSRRFVITFAGGGGLRASAYLGVGNLDTTSTQFTYDTQLQFSDTTHVARVELDMNQVLSSGDTVIFGTQCDFVGGFWQYTSNVAGAATWNNSTIPCTKSAWTANTWHHIQVGTHRDSVGNVTYDYVNFDGTRQNFGAITVNSHFALGWTPLGTKLVNVQVDSDTTGGTFNLYLDSFSVVGSQPTVSVGAEVRSLQTYGYGTYVWSFRSASDSTNPAANGSPVSGQVSSGFLFNNNSQTELDSSEVEGQVSRNTLAEFTTWESVSNSQNTNVTVSTPWNTYHQYKVIWAPGSATYFVDGVQAASHTQNVPATPAAVLMNIWGTNNDLFGGVSTVGTRWMYFNNFSFVPASTTIPVGGSCTVSVSFKPTIGSADPGFLNVTVPDGGANLSIPLGGNGVSPTKGSRINGGVTVTGGVKVLN